MRLTLDDVCCAVSRPRREPLGASSDPAGSESLPALLHHCITKAKGVAANNNNNTTSARRTGLCHCLEERYAKFVLKCNFGFTRVFGFFFSLSPPPSRCMSLSDPAAISDTPRGRGSQPPRKEEKAKQEEPLSLFDLPAAPQAVRGGPDRHSGQCRLRRPQLRDSPLTRVPTKPLDSTKLTSPSKEKPDLSLCCSPYY